MYILYAVRFFLFIYLSNVFVVAGIDPTAANTIYRTQHSSSRTENIKVFGAALTALMD
jgi:hypothetical protein